MKLNKARPYIIIALVTIISSIVLWIPFLLKFNYINGISTSHNDFHTIYKHWDGPLYIIVAKTWYNPQNPILKASPLGLNAQYFAAHLPLYPFTISLLAPLFGYLQAMILATLLAAIAMYCFFYFFIKKLSLTEQPLLLTIVFMFITPRFLVVRSTGSPEPLFMLLILASLYFFTQRKFLLAGLMGGLSAMTKTPGVLIFFAYFISCIEEFFKTKKFQFSWLGILLIPLGLIAVFSLYLNIYHDFFAYWHTNGVVPMSLPFSVFNFELKWVGTAWLEDIVFVFFFYLMALIYLWDKKKIKPLFYFSTIFFIAITLVQHRDISRYSLPLLPFALIAFEKFLTSKKFLIALVILLPAIYLYSWNFVIFNSAPISDWAPFM